MPDEPGIRVRFNGLGSCFLKHGGKAGQEDRDFKMRAYQNSDSRPSPLPRPRLSPEISEFMHMLSALEDRFVRVAEAAQ